MVAATVHVPHDNDLTTFVQAAASMLARRELAATTALAYSATFRQVAQDLGGRELMSIDSAGFQAVLDARWGSAAPATYNKASSCIVVAVRVGCRPGVDRRQPRQSR